MKTNKTNISAVDKFQKDIKIALELHYKQMRSDNMKRMWEKRKRLSTVRLGL